jgi:hypothetical protein
MKLQLVIRVLILPALTLFEFAPVCISQSLGMRGVVHVQNRGDMPLRDSNWAGTKGQSLRLEGFAVDFAPAVPGLGLEYMCHLQGRGDTGWMAGGSFCGTRGESRRLEGLAIRLTGPAAGQRDIYYACHLQNIGDTGFAMNGDFCGTRGESRRLEAMIVWVLPKGSAPPPLQPNISSFTASPNNGFINVGESATLSWQVSFCGSGCTVSLRGREGLGNSVLNMPNVAASGSQTVTPHFNTFYTLSATNSAGSASKEKEVKLHGTSPSWPVFYFKMTNSSSTVTPCFTIAIAAPDEATAKRIAEQTNGGYTATPISASQFATACGD